MSKKNSPGRYFAYLGLKGLVRFTQIMPPGAGRLACVALFNGVFSLMPGRRRIALDQLRRAFPGESEEGLAWIVRESITNQGRFFAEFFRTPLMTRENVSGFVRFEGLEDFQKTFAGGKGIILVWAHFDHFEWTNAALSLMGYPVYPVIREMDNPGVDRLFDGFRESAGEKVIKREQAAAEIIKRLREGAAVSIAADQNTIFNNVYVKFFGEWTSTVKSPAVLHLRTGAPIVPFYTLRNPDGSHTAHLLPALRAEKTGDLKFDVFCVTQRIAEIQEAFIRRGPEFWLWVHRRWKTRPDEAEERVAAEMYARYTKLKRVD